MRVLWKNIPVTAKKGNSKIFQGVTKPTSKSVFQQPIHRTPIRYSSRHLAGDGANSPEREPERSPRCLARYARRADPRSAAPRAAAAKDAVDNGSPPRSHLPLRRTAFGVGNRRGRGSGARVGLGRAGPGRPARVRAQEWNTIIRGNQTEKWWAGWPIMYACMPEPGCEPGCEPCPRLLWLQAPSVAVDHRTFVADISIIWVRLDCWRDSELGGVVNAAGEWITLFMD